MEEQREAKAEFCGDVGEIEWFEWCPRHVAVRMWNYPRHGGAERYCPVCVFDRNKELLLEVYSSGLDRTSLEAQLEAHVNANASWVRWSEHTTKQLRELEERDKIRSVTVEKLATALSESNRELEYVKGRLQWYVKDEIAEEHRKFEEEEADPARRLGEEPLDARAAIQQDYFRETFARQLGLYLEWLEKKMAERRE